MTDKPGRIELKGAMHLRQVGIKQQSITIGGIELRAGGTRERERDFKENLEARTKEAAARMQDEFNKNAKRERDAYKNLSDASYWVCVVFQTAEQKVHFLREMNWSGDPETELYIDGRMLAEAAGVKLPPDVRFTKTHNFTKQKALLDEMGGPAGAAARCPSCGRPRPHDAAACIANLKSDVEALTSLIPEL